MASSVLESSEEKIYGFKLMRLIVDGGTEVLRNIIINIHPSNLHAVLSTHYPTLYPLFKTKKIITQPQWDKLYPPPPKIPNIQEFDITLLVILLRNICGLFPPTTGWNVMPGSTDNSREANIVRIKQFRNNFFGHIPSTGVSSLEFEAHWVEVGSALRSLGLNQAEIDRLKAEECGEEEVNRVRTEWNESEREVVTKLDGFEKIIHESERKIMSKLDGLEKRLEVHEPSYESSKQVKSSFDDILSNSLHWCDFEKEMQLLLERYTEGTREWVFQQVSTWLNDTASDNRAFIISGQAGMGKSMIAAVTCKRFPKHFAGCHFFQYNDSRYNNPKFLLQSLAWQLCNVVPEYKKNLSCKLSGSKGQILDELNIEGLFTMLFKEPLTNIPDPGKHFLIVIDALDECQQEERYELVDLITRHFHKIPRFIRFLITTRSEKDIALKFQGLNPMFLVPDDERNLNDLRLFFEDKLLTTMRHPSQEELVKNLVKISEGLMLYASFLCKLSKDGSIKSNIESLPKGIEEIYETYFDRLENELKILGIEEEKFLSLLSVIAVAKQPLPSAIIKRLLSSERDSLSAERTLLKLLSCISSLLVIKDDCVPFFHKSVKDWLVKTNHRFTIKEKYGHKTLADICVFQMETLKQNEVSLTFNHAIVYALHYGIQHMLEADIKDMHSLTKLINHVTDVEIVHASVCSDIYATLSNLSSLESYNMNNSLICEEIQTTVRTLVSIIRKFTFILKDFPKSFLQHVVNENDDVLSSKASALLMTRYRKVAYFESEDKKENIEKAIIGRILTRESVKDIDISPSEDFLICGYEIGVELFSLPDFKPLWKIDDFVVERIAARFKRKIVFHPLENVIFPGQLTPVLNFKGKFESGRIACKEIHNKFTSCCFSHDKRKMVTIYGIHLAVWNLFENEKIASLSCQSELFSVLFSANDRFIGTTNINELCVYDTENSYSMVSRSCGAGNFAVLVSTFYSDSWFVCTCQLSSKAELENEMVMKYDLTSKPVSVPFIGAWPANARAASEFQAVVEGDDPSSLNKVSYSSFFILSNKSVLVSSYYKSEIKLLRLTELIQSSNKEKRGINWFPFECRFSVSVDGRYIYSHTLGPMCHIVKLCWPVSLKSIKLHKERQDWLTKNFFVPVSHGVFFCAEVRSSSIKLFMRKSTVFAGIPELWNFGVTERLASFPELTGTFHCLSVAQDLVACIMESQVCFFNVVKKAIVARTPFPEHILVLLREHELEEIDVIACSSLYHVLMRNKKSTYLLQYANSVDLKSCVLEEIVQNIANRITTACFSPNGRFLALVSSYWKTLYILEVATLNIRGNFFLYSTVGSKLKFVDEEHLLCEGYNDCLCLINVKSCDILTCISLDLRFNDHPWCIFACRNTVGIIVYSSEYRKFKLTKLWLPQQRKDGNELPECSCWIHGRNINEPPTPTEVHSRCSIT